MIEDRAAIETDVVTQLSRQSVAGTVAKLTGMISAKGMRLFAVIDQAAEARQAGLALRETTLVIFGSPEAGTPMAASPLAALDLPLKVLVWADGDQTKVSYYAPAALAASHHLTADLAANLRHQRPDRRASGGNVAAIPAFIRADFASATRDVLYGMAVIMAVAALVALRGLRRGVQEDTVQTAEEFSSQLPGEDPGADLDRPGG